MIKVEMSSGIGVSPEVLCNICGEPICHYSEGIGVFQGEGSLLRFHHRNCAVGGFTEHWPSLPMLEIILKTAAHLGITRDHWPEGVPDEEKISPPGGKNLPTG